MRVFAPSLSNRLIPTLLSLSLQSFLHFVLVTLPTSTAHFQPLKPAMHLSPDFSSSEPLRHYRLHETLGAGNFAKVKRATHLLTAEAVAVKIISHGKTGLPNDKARISREVEIMRKLNHPNVVPLYDVGPRQVVTVHSQTYLVMEYLQGGDLLSYVAARQRLQESEACRLFQQLVSGVGYLHGLGVSHRDLKPSNLLLTTRKDVKIADFGLSAEGRMEALETRCGSPCFTAPEVITGMTYDGRKVDIWGLGVVLYVMLVGELPFEDDNKAGLFRKICTGRYTLPACVSQSAKDLLRRMLVVEAKGRATLAEVRKHPWLAVAELPKRTVQARHAIDSSVFSEAQALGFSHKALLEGLELNLKNAATATYQLLLNRRTQADDIVELLRTNRSHLKRSETHFLVRRRNTASRPTPEPIPSLSPKPLDRKDTVFLHRMALLRPVSQWRSNKRTETQRPTVCLLRLHRAPTPV